MKCNHCGEVYFGADPHIRCQPNPEPGRDWLAEARDIIDGKPSLPRMILRLPERKHLVAIVDFYEGEE